MRISLPKKKKKKEEEEEEREKGLFGLNQPN
jgi:hypothetical protein